MYLPSASGRNSVVGHCELGVSTTANAGLPPLQSLPSGIVASEFESAAKSLSDIQSYIG